MATINNVVDVEVDFKTRITAKSNKTWDVIQAKNQAYYNAIVSNNVDVLVDPIYEVKSHGRRSQATVTGYAGRYKNVRTVKQENQAVLEQNLHYDSLVLVQKMRLDKVAFEQSMANLDKKIQALDRFSQVGAVSKEDLKTYLITTGCCMAGGGSASGGTEELLNTDLGIVNIFNALLMSGPVSATEATPITPATTPGAVEAKPMISQECLPTGKTPKNLKRK